MYEKPLQGTGHRDIVSGVLVYGAYALNSMAITPSGICTAGCSRGVSNGLSFFTCSPVVIAVYRPSLLVYCSLYDHPFTLYKRKTTPSACRMHAEWSIEHISEDA